MKDSRKFSWLISVCLIVNCVPMEARAQKVDDSKATGQLVNVWIGVTSMAFPEAAPFLEAGGKLLDLLEVFGKPDATGEALKRINERLDRIEGRLNQLDQKITALQNDFFREKNYTRIQLLRTKRELLQGLVVQLQEKPAQPDAKRELVKAVQQIADDFLDPELWNWSDMQVGGLMLDPDFKPLPTLELYATTLVTWMATIGYAYGDNIDFVKKTYGAAFKRHINYLNQTLPDNVRTRITAHINSIDKYPNNRVCAYKVSIEDQIRHLVRNAGEGQVQMPSNNVMCSVPEAMGQVAMEGQMERAYGIDVMEALAAKLDRLRTRGTLGEGYSGEFDKTAYQQDFIYAINPNGELLWYRHLIAGRPQPPPPDPRKVKTEVPPPNRHKLGTEAGGKIGTPTSGQSKLGDMSRIRGGDTSSGTDSGGGAGREQGAHKVADAVRGLEVIHHLDGPKSIGTGWGQFRDVIPAGKDSIYALTQDGILKWYRYGSLWDDKGSPPWKGPVDVGSGWQSFVRIVPAGDGILYAIDTNGALKWYRHSGYLDGSVSWSGPIDVSPTQRSPLGPRFSKTWTNFKQVFSGGEGVMYAITGDGVLQWYRHRGYLTGTPDWEGPRNVGTGWQDFTRVFATGDGNIYAMNPTGEVLWYKHAGYKDGSVSWQGPVEIAADWKDFIFVFPQMSGTWTPPVIH